MFLIDLYDIFVGFVDFIALHPLNREEIVAHNDSTWTSMVYQYFISLGTLLGFNIERERMLSQECKSCDLIWFHNDPKDRYPVLHLESESGNNLETSLEKLKNTTARGGVLVTYTETIDVLEPFVSKLQSTIEKWNKSNDYLFVIIPWIDYKKEELYPITGILQQKGNLKIFKVIVPAVKDFIIER
jgi:hypothetical protein